MTPVEELSKLLRPAGGGLYLVSTGRAEQSSFMRRFYGADDDEDVTERFVAQLHRIAQAKVVLMGVPSDVGAGFRRGANLGPQALREELLRADAGFGAYCDRHSVVDIGDVFVVPQLLHDDMLSAPQLERSRAALYPELTPQERASFPVSPLSIAKRAWSLVLQINPSAKPLLLGGDHSTAWPVVEALHAAQQSFCIVQMDAHTDLLKERLGVELCFATWSYHANDLIGRERRLIQVGVRATQRPREHWESTLDVRQVWPSDFSGDEPGLVDAVVAAARETGLPVYLSNDIDGTDSAQADATGTPEPDGLSEAVVTEIIQRLGREAGLVGADLVEVAPGLGADGGTRTVQLGARYLRASLDALLKARPSAGTSSLR